MIFPFIVHRIELAEIQLDGSGSSDADDDLLNYVWSWEIDQQEFTAEGAAPTIELPLGVHEIALVVNDGTVDSDPNSVTVTVYNTAPVADAGADITVYCGFESDLSRSDTGRQRVE